MVVVYKIDRLTRSLADFARLVERLEAAGCSFVSVTQAFNTSSSMGRLTLNVLLSFAQFEREVTAERIRDKIAASKKKGLWMGGLAPLGYDPHPDRTRRELVVNEAEAGTVRRLFALYLEHGCLNATARAAGKLGLRSKRRVFANGRQQGGGAFSRGQVHKILTNPVYLGQVRHKDRLWPGTHPAILSQDTWDGVQARLQAASAIRRGGGRAPATASPLKGLFRDETGDLLTPTHTRRRDRRLCYYVSNRLVSGGPDPSAWRLPAPAFESAVAKILAEHLDRRAAEHAVLAGTDIAAALATRERARALASRLGTEGARAAAPLIASGRIARGTIALDLDREALAEALGCGQGDLDPRLLVLGAPFTCRRRGVETKIVAGDTLPRPDPVLVRALAEAHRWAAALRSGTPLGAVALAEGHAESHVRTRTRLAFLAPRIQAAILAGTLPADVTLKSLLRGPMPLDWDTQLRRCGL